MKKTGRRVYLSGIVRTDTAEKVYNDGSSDVGAIQNILVDERRGYAYKVTFASVYPNITNAARISAQGYGIYSYSRRELLRMTDAQAAAALGFTRDLAVDNRNVGIVGVSISRVFPVTPINNLENYQNQYVIKGDAMVTQSLAIGFSVLESQSQVSYYIEMDEYEVNDDEEILLILNERSQNAAGIA